MKTSKSLILTILLILAVLWACIATFLLYRGSVSLHGKQVSESSFEELSFLKQFTSQYFTYDSDNFWQTQVSLTNLMEPALKERRLQEISLLKERTASKSFLQIVEILSIRAISQNSFEISVKVTSFEEQKKTEILIQTTIELSPHTPSAETPWGYKVKNLTVKSLSTPDTPSEVSKAITVMSDRVLTLMFPCAIENVTGIDSNWKYRIITSHTSEVQLSLLMPAQSTQNLVFNCQEQSFTLDAQVSTSYPIDLYKSIPLSFAIKRAKKKPFESVPKEDRQKIENELNFIISE